MLKVKKVILKVIPIVLLLVTIINIPVFADPDTIFDYNNAPGRNQGSINKIDTTVSDIWSVISMVLKLAAVASIIFAGVRYMYASADSRADIKNSLIILIIGAILVFGSSSIVDLVTKATADIL